MKIAAVACESEIIHVIGSTVLLRDNVLDMMPVRCVPGATGSIRTARQRDAVPSPVCRLPSATEARSRAADGP